MLHAQGLNLIICADTTDNSVSFFPLTSVEEGKDAMDAHITVCGAYTFVLTEEMRETEGKSEETGNTDLFTSSKLVSINRH